MAAFVGGEGWQVHDATEYLSSDERAASYRPPISSARSRPEVYMSSRSGEPLTASFGRDAPQAMRRRPRGARRSSVRRADRPHCGRRASPQAPLRRGARAYAGATRRHRPDHRLGVDLPAIDAHRAAEAAADLERRFDDGVAPEARRDRLEIGDFAGWAAAGHSVPPRQVRCGRLDYMQTERQNGSAHIDNRRPSSVYPFTHGTFRDFSSLSSAIIRWNRRSNPSVPSGR